MSRKVYHSCALCQKTILLTQMVIQKHTKNQHNMEAREYHQRHILGVENHPSYCDVPIPAAKVYSPDFITWVNKCIFQCRICSKTSHSNLSYHIKQRHNLSMEEYKKTQGPLMSQMVKHTCAICKKDILLTMPIFQKHMKSQHNIDGEDYFKTVLTQNQSSSCDNTRVSTSIKIVDSTDKWKDACTYKCQLCRLILPSDEAMNQHLLSSHSMTTEFYESKFGSTLFTKVNHKCKICQVNIQHDAKNLDIHMTLQHGLSLVSYFQSYISGPLITPDSMLTSWMNKCMFHCKICQNQFTSLSAFQRHISEEHAISLMEYEAAHGSAMISAKYHFCSLCQSAVTSDAEYIREHLVNISNCFNRNSIFYLRIHTQTLHC